MDLDRKTFVSEKKVIDDVVIEELLVESTSQCMGICTFPHSQCVREQFSVQLPKNNTAKNSNKRKSSHSRKLMLKNQLLDMLFDSKTILQKANSLREKCELLLQDDVNDTKLGTSNRRRKVRFKL